MEENKPKYSDDDIVKYDYEIVNERHKDDGTLRGFDVRVNNNFNNPDYPPIYYMYDGDLKKQFGDEDPMKSAILQVKGFSKYENNNNDVIYPIEGANLKQFMSESELRNNSFFNDDNFSTPAPISEATISAPINEEARKKNIAEDEVIDSILGIKTEKEANSPIEPTITSKEPKIESEREISNISEAINPISEPVSIAKTESINSSIDHTPIAETEIKTSESAITPIAETEVKTSESTITPVASKSEYNSSESNTINEISNSDILNTVLNSYYNSQLESNESVNSNKLEVNKSISNEYKTTANNPINESPSISDSALLKPLGYSSDDIALFNSYNTFSENNSENTSVENSDSKVSNSNLFNSEYNSLSNNGVNTKTINNQLSEQIEVDSKKIGIDKNVAPLRSTTEDIRSISESIKSVTEKTNEQINTKEPEVSKVENSSSNISRSETSNIVNNEGNVNDSNVLVDFTEVNNRLRKIENLLSGPLEVKIVD